jgi:hypothetical protein
MPSPWRYAATIMPKAIGAKRPSNLSTASVCWQRPKNSIANRHTAQSWMTHTMSDALERSIDEAERLFVSAGKAKVEAEAMDLRRKRVRAALFVKYKGAGNPAGASEQMAEADPVYELACADWETAALQSETLRAQAEAKRLRFEAWRTQESTKRAQMNLR